MTARADVSRRDFLRTTAAVGAGLTIATWLPGCASKPAAAAPGAGFAPNAFLRIGTDDTVTVIAKHLEMGQGAYTGLATIVADELDADWSRVAVEGAPADDKRYGNASWGGAMGTGGSSTISNSFQPMREAGAAARAMLVAAAAKRWNVAAGEITVANGVVSHAGSGKSARFGELVTDAAALPVPTTVTLKEPSAFRLIGKEDLPRLDIPAKVTGRATFTQDFKLPGMLTALVAHPPRFGGAVKSFDASKAKAVPGVTDVVQIPTGVAVLAKDFWAAKQGRDALAVEWDDAKAEQRSSDALWQEYRALGAKPGKVAKAEGDAAKAIAGAAKVVEATYELPYLAHAAMEPMNCVVQLTKDGCEIWYGAQMQSGDKAAVMKALKGGLAGRVANRLGMGEDSIRLNMLYAGGSFGRRAAAASDYVLEGVSIAQAIDGRAPVKLVWTREDDTRAGYFRPMFLHAMRGGVDGQGNVVGWQSRSVGQAFWTLSKEGIDEAGVEGLSDIYYDVPSVQVENHIATSPVTTQWWRSVGHSHTAFAKECFVDELARAAGKDPVEFRRALLAKQPRLLGVLNLAAEKAGWGTPPAPGVGRGVAVHKSFDSYVAEVAEVLVGKDGSLKVQRVVCAVDCGIVVNPDIVRAQMESGIAYGLGAALYGAITLDGGVVREANFDRYRTLRLADMPVVEVHIVPSTESPTGVGEPGLPPIAPAVANAIASITGKPERRLPLRA
jgi:isoquinoline 1-oxidoreductase beta subunit